ncbi:MAG: sulfur carrier protein ThiS [Thermovirgaceae bacterium]|nr:sulfur carrier protein ThiS [Thermovirgaceae bacterium]
MITINGEKMEWKAKMTVQDIISEKRYVFPLLAVWIDGTSVARDNFGTAEVPDDASVQVIHMISGG